MTLKGALAAAAVLLLGACSTTTSGHPDSSAASSEAGATPALRPQWNVRIDGDGQGTNQLTGGTSDGRRLYVSDLGGEVFALDPASGKVAWQRRIGARVAPAVALASDALLVDDTDHGLYAADPATGRTLWHDPDPAAAPYTIAPAVAHGLLLYPHRDELRAVAPRTGVPAWRRTTVPGHDDEYLRSVWPTTDGQRFFALAQYADKPLDEQLLVALDAATGRPAWQVQLPTVQGAFPTLYVFGGLVVRSVSVGGGQGERLDAVDARSGRPRWTLDVPRGDTTKQLTQVGPHLYVPSLAGAVRVDPASGRTVGPLPKDQTLGADVHACAGHPCVANDGHVYAFDSSGKLTGELAVPKEILDPRLLPVPGAAVYAYGAGRVVRYG
jgi:outer membrane protein assembly factor BamB